jgi:diguanylate cyclase (GGDEF)-like protein
VSGRLRRWLRRPMMLNNHTLIFSLMLISALMAISLFVVGSRDRREGLALWGAAMALISVGWMFVDARGSIPDMISITLANTLFSASISLELAAVHEYRGLTWSRWQYVAPVLATMLVFSLVPLNNLRDHLLVSSIIYGAQFLMLAIALYGDNSSRSGHAWWLLFGATLLMLPVMVLRGLAAHFGHLEFADLRSPVMPNPIQLATYICVMTTITLGSIGFILMTKERTDREIQHLAQTDPLTRLLNRRAFLNQAADELSFCRRHLLPLALIMLDVDHFKHINDRHGHLIGDDVLIELSRLLTARLRVRDILGRYGGEEFCILLPGTNNTGARAVAESMRQAVESTAFAAAFGGVAVTISLGVAVFDITVDTDMNLTRLFEDADAALYQAKRQGRNCTSMNQPISSQRGAVMEEPSST